MPNASYVSRLQAGPNGSGRPAWSQADEVRLRLSAGRPSSRKRHEIGLHGAAERPARRESQEVRLRFAGRGPSRRQRDVVRLRLSAHRPAGRHRNEVRRGASAHRPAGRHSDEIRLRLAADRPAGRNGYEVGLRLAPDRPTGRYRNEVSLRLSADRPVPLAILVGHSHGPSDDIDIDREDVEHGANRGVAIHRDRAVATARARASPVHKVRSRGRGRSQRHARAGVVALSAIRPARDAGRTAGHGAAASAGLGHGQRVNRKGECGRRRCVRVHGDLARSRAGARATPPGECGGRGRRGRESDRGRRE